MKENEKIFEKFFSQIKFDDSPDPNHRDKLEQELLASLAKQQAGRQIKVWRTIMKNRIAKLAAAAAIILIAVLGITLLNKSTTPAWAIGDTAEAIDQFNAIYISGTIAKGDLAEEDTVFTEDKRIPFEVWAQANEERTQSGNLRFETSGHVTVVNDMTTYTYDANTNTVHIQPDNQFIISPWFTGDFLIKLEQMSEDLDLLYGKDAASGRERVFVTLTYPPMSRSYWIEIDLETKLPVRGKQWHNPHRKGTPAFDLERIIYFEDLPDDLFELEISEDATIIEKQRD